MNAESIKTLVPGLLVGLRTSLKGNVKYYTEDIAPDLTAPAGGTVKAWKAEKIVQDAEEHALAMQVRSRARTLIVGVCAASQCGYLCPESRVDDLMKAITEARRVVIEFNASARYTQITLGVVAGRIAASDTEAARAINGEMSELIESMQRGVERLDPAAIRDAANKARDLQVMLTPDMQSRVQESIDAVRKEARRLSKAGQGAAIACDRALVDSLAFARASFLDVDGEAQTYTIATPVIEGLAVDLHPDAISIPAAEEAPELDLDNAMTDYIRPLSPFESSELDALDAFDAPEEESE